MRPKSPKEILNKSKTPAVLLSDLTNIQYLSGVHLSEGLMLITSRSQTLFVDGRYKEVAEKEAYSGVKVRDIDTVSSSIKKIPKCAVESSLTLERYTRWKKAFKNTKLVQTKALIEEYRSTKSPEEIKNFRASQKITRALMKKIPTALKPGITERELEWIIRTWARELGAEEMAFDPIVAFGSNTSRPHHEPTHRKLKKRDIVQIDCGVKKYGYCSDQSRVFFVGKPTALQEKVYASVERAKAAAESLVRPGVTNHALDKAATAELEKDELDQYFVHSLGHGLGLYIHESPGVSQHAKRISLQKGHIITIEPGVYLPGKFGIRLEDEVVVE